MKFQRKHWLCRDLVVGGTAILPGTASARTAGHLDPAHDVVKEAAAGGGSAASQATESTTQRLGRR
jgi:hypothetical protein